MERRNLRYAVFVLVIENAEGDFQLVRCRAWILALQRRWQARQFFDRNNTVMGMIAFEEQDAPGAAELAQSLAGLPPENGYLRLGLSAGHVSAGQVWEAYEEARIAFEWNDGQDAPVAVQSYRPEMMAQQGKGFAVTLRMQSVLANAVLTGNVGEMQGSLNEIYAENKRLNHYWQRRLSGHLLDLLLVFSRNKGEMDNTLLHSHLSWLSSRNNVLLRRHVYEHYQALTEVPMEREDEAIVRIRRYVEEHLGEDISLTEVAAHAGLSYNYVSTRFSEVFGMNFSNYLLISRLKKAKRLLQATDLPIAEVGRQAGYLVTSSFIRLFKKHEGITPGAYREMTQKESGGLR